MSLKIRRGTDSERVTITPAEGELIYTTDTKLLYVGDGTTSGGRVVTASGGGGTGFVGSQGDVGFAGSRGLQGDVGFVGSASTVQGPIGYTGSATRIPTGGTTGQVLSKVSGTDYDVNWSTVSGGGGNGGTLTSDLNISTYKIANGQNLVINGTDYSITTSTLYSNVPSSTFPTTDYKIIKIGSKSNNNQLSLYWGENNSDDAVISINGSINPPYGSPQIEFKSSRGTLNSPTVLSSGDFISKFQAKGYDGNSFINTSGIVFCVDPNKSVSSGAVPGSIIFFTQATSDPSSGIGHIITSDGYLGINKTNPSTHLDVNGSGKFSGYVQFGSYTTTNRGNLTPANGMIIYNTTVNKFQGYQNSSWINLDNGSAA